MGVTEGGGAAGVAAIIANALPELKGKTVATVLCGGNIDASTLTRVIDRGLIAEGRICRFTVVVSDRPGGIAEMLCKSQKVWFFIGLNVGLKTNRLNHIQAIIAN